MKNNTWIRSTGQQWKLVVVYMLVALLAIVVVGGLLPSVGHAVTSNEDLFRLLSIPAGAAALAWIALAVRCPNCKSRTGLWYLRNMGVSQWFTAFVGTQRCPQCGYDGDKRSLIHPESNNVGPGGARPS